MASLGHNELKLKICCKFFSQVHRLKLLVSQLPVATKNWAELSISIYLYMYISISLSSGGGQEYHKEDVGGGEVWCSHRAMCPRQLNVKWSEYGGPQGGDGGGDATHRDHAAQGGDGTTSGGGKWNMDEYYKISGAIKEITPWRLS